MTTDMRHRLTRVVVFFGATAIVALSSVAAHAGGTCILHPEPFRLQSDTVRWSIKLTSGSECIQGLRWSSLMINKITVVEEPKAGRVIIAGPSFRYLSNPGSPGNDSFKLAISGNSLRIDGTSSIEVDVTSR